MRLIMGLLLITLIGMAGCGGGGGGTPSPTQNGPGTFVFPLKTAVDKVYKLNPDSFFFLSDGSMWVYKGSTVDPYIQNASGQYGGLYLKPGVGITIYSSVGSTITPKSGVKAGYFLLVDNDIYSYFVEPYEIKVQNGPGTFVFPLKTAVDKVYKLNPDSFFFLSDGSMWVYKGSTVDPYIQNASGQYGGLYLKPGVGITIYSSVGSTITPKSGVKAGYFLLVDNDIYSYFVEPYY